MSYCRPGSSSPTLHYCCCSGAPTRNSNALTPSAAQSFLVSGTLPVGSGTTPTEGVINKCNVIEWENTVQRLIDGEMRGMLASELVELF